MQYELTVHLKPNAPAGYIKEQLTLVTNDRRATEFPLDIEGRSRVVAAATPEVAAELFAALSR